MLPTMGNFILLFLFISADLVHTSPSLEGNRVCVQGANDMPGLVKPGTPDNLLSGVACALVHENRVAFVLRLFGILTL